MKKTTRLKKPQIPELETLYQFDDLGGRPKYGGEEMTSATDIPSFQEIMDETHSAVVAEATARDDADEELQAQIDTQGERISDEAATRQAADTLLSQGIADEASARQSADASLASDIATEASTRQTADTNLQTQIDAIVASSDVKDIVGTYAELQQYDTSTLGDQDIIKVLADETHDDAMYYYRWNAATTSFSGIGSEGPYYTKGQADGRFVNQTAYATDKAALEAEIATKQDELTAGSNVQISGNVISATDTTYSDFTGTDGQTAGTAGLVPAPATTDADKYLKGDGAWGIVDIEKTVSEADYDPVTNRLILWNLEAGVYKIVSNNSADYLAGTIHNGNGGNRNLRVGGILVVDEIGGASATPLHKWILYPEWAASYGIASAVVDASGTLGGYSNGLLLGTSDVINNLTSTSSLKPLSANQGRILNENKLAKANLLAGDGVLLTNAGSGAGETITVSYKHLDGAGAPTVATTGDYVGQLYYDTTNDEMYYLASIDDSVDPVEYNWNTISSGPTVVQTTGTSTSDVMSQKAVTDELYLGGSTFIGKSRASGSNNGPSTIIGSISGSAPSGLDTLGKIAIGNNININNSQPDTIQIGNNAVAGSGNNIAIGQGATTGVGSGALAIGPFANNAAGYGVALGMNTKALRGGVAIGYGAHCSRQGEVNVSSSSASYGYNNTVYRVIGGVHDPVDAYDAANKNYTDNLVVEYAALNGFSAPTTATEGKYIGQLYYDITNDEMYYLASIDYTVDPAEYNWNTIGGGPAVVQTTGTSTTDVMSQVATSQMIYPSGYETDQTRIAIGGTASNVHSTAICKGAVASGYGSLAVGLQGNGNTGATASGEDTIALGGRSTASERHAIAIGLSAQATGRGAVVIGNGASAAGGSTYVGSVAIGPSAQTSNSMGVAIGQNVRAHGNRSVALAANYSGEANGNASGDSSIAISGTASAPGSVALGYGSNAGHQSSIALGNGAFTTRSGEVNIGAVNTSYGYNSTNYRVLGGVHPAVDDHDAVTLGQMNAAIPATLTNAEYTNLWSNA